MTIATFREEVRNWVEENFTEEIVNAGLYLISDKASFMTGEVMHVNGGSNFG